MIGPFAVDTLLQILSSMSEPLSTRTMQQTNRCRRAGSLEEMQALVTDWRFTMWENAHVKPMIFGK
jgi:hypothetical protein